MELTWETVMRLTCPLVAVTSRIALRVEPVVFEAAVSFTVAVPLAPADGLDWIQEAAGFAIVHWELQVMVTPESAPCAGKLMLDADTDNCGALPEFFLQPTENAMAIICASKSLENVAFICYKFECFVILIQ